MVGANKLAGKLREASVTVTGKVKLAAAAASNYKQVLIEETSNLHTLIKFISAITCATYKIIKAVNFSRALQCSQNS